MPPSDDESPASVPTLDLATLAIHGGEPRSKAHDAVTTPISCTATYAFSSTAALRDRLRLDDSKLLLTFQSRFGNAEWLQPYTDKTIARLAKDGVRRIAVVMPGFAADCLETLEEIARENADIFKHNGGESFTAIPCLNDSEAGMGVIRKLVLRELQGWL